MHKSKWEIEQDEKWEQYRSRVSGMSDQRISAELEKRRKKISEITCQGNENPEYRDALLQLNVLTDVLRERLGSRSRTDRMQIRG